MRFLGRLVLLAVGLLVAVPFGFLALLIGVLVDPTARDLLAALGMAGLEAVLADGFLPDPEAFSGLVRLWTGLLILLVLPPVFAALVGEAAGWRSFAWYGGATGGLTAALPFLARPGGTGAMLPAEGRIATILFLSGAASGLLYWLVAGRGAGRRARSPGVSAPRSSGS